eukprot:GHVP01051812.1.p1 GENE.GHVP01051812.1~~GHVP01051812.1.p1  ORF type:complete len:140 (+),score=23.55 GHVP01051812.1:383-802(+)
MYSYMSDSESTEGQDLVMRNQRGKAHSKRNSPYARPAQGLVGLDKCQVLSQIDQLQQRLSKLNAKEREKCSQELQVRNEVQRFSTCHEQKDRANWDNQLGKYRFEVAKLEHEDDSKTEDDLKAEDVEKLADKFKAVDLK